jgi:hypothetical protein
MTLHRLAWAYDPAVGIFQVSQGTEFSTVGLKERMCVCSVV